MIADDEFWNRLYGCGVGLASRAGQQIGWRSGVPQRQVFGGTPDRAATLCCHVVIADGELRGGDRQARGGELPTGVLPLIAA